MHVVEHVEERIAAAREPGVEGRELRRGMEREMALSFLNRLGGSAGAHPLGCDARGPLGAAGPDGGLPHLLQQVYDQKHSTGPQVEAGKMAA